MSRMWLKWAAVLSAMAACALVGEAGGETVFRGAHHWLSRNEWKQDDDSGVTIKPKTSNSISGGARVFDLTISMYKERTEEERALISDVLTNFAYAVYEATDGHHKIGKIKIYEDGRNGCDIEWTASGWPCANLARSGGNGQIYMFDIFADDDGSEILDFVSNTYGRLCGGFTIAHEWGHAVYGLGDEYEIDDDQRPAGLNEQREVIPSIMNSSDDAVSSEGSISDPRWLNFSIASMPDAPDQFYRNTGLTAQHLYHGQSCWEQLKSPNNFGTSQDALRYRGYTQSYPEFANKDVTRPPSIEINTTQGKSRAVSELEIEWPGKSALMWGICIDRSGSMSSSDMANVRQRASHLVDIAPVGTLISVNVFNASISTIFPFTEVTSENRASLKSQIASIPSSSGNTALWDAAYRMLGDIDAIDTTHKNVASIVLLTDGQDNVSSHTKAQIVSRCKLMGVSFNSIAYGSYADSNLQSASEETGGSYNRSSQSMLGLEAAFSRTITYVSSRGALADYQYTMPDGGALTNKFYIDSNLTNVHVSVGFSSSSGVTAFILDPNSVQIMPSTTNYLGSEVSFGFDVSQYNVGEYKVLMSAGAGTKATLYADADMLQGGPSVSGMVSERDGCAYVTVSDLYSIDDATVCAMLPTANGQYRKVPFEGGGCGMYRLPLRDCGNNFVVEINAIANVAKKIYDDGMVSPIEKSGSEPISQSFTRILTLATSVSYTNQYQNANATWRYGVADGECIIASGEVYVPAVACCKKTAIVPSEIDGKAVVSLGDYTFYGNNAVNIIVPASVKNIGYETFAGCTNLVRVAFLGKPPAISDWESFKDSMIGMTILYNLEYSNEWGSFASMFDGLSVTFEGYSRLNNGTWIVDGVHGDDNNVGISASYPLASISAAIDIASDGDKILVADGVYEPFTCANRSIVIESVNGPRYTIIDGGGTNRCATLGTSEGQTNTVLHGFTLRNGNANGSAVAAFAGYGGGVYNGTLENCVIVNNEARWGGGVCNSSLVKCSIVGNRAGNANDAGYGGGVLYWYCPNLLANECYIADNRAYYGSAVYGGNTYCAIRNSHIVKNTALYQGAVYANAKYEIKVDGCTIVDNNCTPSYRPGTYYVSSTDSVIYFNYARPDNYNNSDSCYGSLTNCCTTVEGSTCIGTGIVTMPPSFIDREFRIYDLLFASGEKIVGAGKVVDTNGMFKVGVEIDGYGVVTRPGAVVAPGESLEFNAEETGRAFEGFYTNGVFATAGKTLELNDIRSDIRVTAKFAKRTAYVAANGNDGNDGLTAATPKQTINAALPLVENGEAIEVAPGTYAPIAPTGYASKGKSIRIYSTHGVAQTIIDGCGTNRCADLSDYYGGSTNVVLEGFTLTNGNSAGMGAGGGVLYGTLLDCMITDNVAETEGGGAMNSYLVNCVVARNRAGTDGGGTCYGVAEHCTICGNEAGGFGGGTFYGTVRSSIVCENVAGGGEANWYNGTFDLCCTYPNHGNAPISGDPLLVDGWNGDARLRVGSPCIVDGVQICGAYVGEPVEGVSVSVGVQGAGAVSNETILVTSGGNATIEAVETVRPFLYWNINGEHITNQVHTLTNVTADVRAIAVFGTYDWYVDAEYGDDANDGSDWDAAKRTLQAAVDAAVDDEAIYVEAGTYAPISTGNKRIRIESMNGAEMTFIDGGGTNRCATLGTISAHTNSALIGFTLLNGRAPQSGSYAYGGGSYSGTLEYSVISNCLASGYYAYGGGAYYGHLNNCLVAYNCATSSYAYGGGTYGSTLRSCTVARNCSFGSSSAYAGGTYGSSYSAYNTIIWDNEVRASSASSAYYPNTHYQYLYYCCTDGTVSYRKSGCVTNDPQFVDADAGDFHLKVGSPCLDAGYDWYVQGDMDLDWDDRIQGVRVDMGCYEDAEYAEPPGQVTGLRAVRGVLAWDAMPDADGFMVYRSTRRVASSAKYIGMADTNAYADETAVEGTTYYYWVTAFNTLGLGVRSDVAENSWPILLEIITSELPDATEMVEYTAQLEATGGTAPYSWEVGTYGYVVSREASSFRDDSGTAQDWNADDNAWLCNLPFAFPFYGKAYTNLYVSSNGTISFGKEVHSWSYSESTFKATPMISVLWNDLTTSGTGFNVFVEMNGTCATIRWRGAYLNGQAVNFSATLYDTGDIRLAYGGGNANGGYVGVSAGDGQQRQLVGSSSASWANARDVVFSTGAFVPSAAVLPFGVSFSSSGLLHGTPTEAGTANLVFRVTDSAGGHDIRELPFTVAANPNERPVIESVTPTNAVTFVKVGDSRTFSVVASDPEGNPLSYRWTVDGENVDGAVADCYTYRPVAGDEGNVRVLTCYVSDDLWTDKVLTNWTVKVPRTIYVDVATTNEEWAVDGSAPELAYPSLSRALDYAEIGDTILVAPGVYSNDGQYDDGYLYFRSYGIGYGESGAVITVKSMAGAERTTIQGAVYNDDHNHWQREDWVRYYYGGYYGGYYEQSPALPVLEGFTLCCSAVQGVSLVNCSVKGGDDGAETSGLSGCRLSNCTVTGCSSSYELLYSCELTRCTVAGNTVPDGCFAVDEGSLVIDSIVHGNMTAAGVAANYNPSIYQGYAWEETEDGYREWTVDVPCVVFTNSCACPLPTMAGSDGNIADDPRLVDAANGDLRLRVGSPCIVDGIQTMGAWLGGPVAGAVVAVRVEGHGAVSPMTAVVSDGRDVAFDISDFTRQFLGFYTNGVFATSAASLVWRNISEDGIVTAVFSNYTFHVDAAAGSDSNDGLSWASAKASIQAAVGEALDGEAVYVKPGTYGPINSNGKRIRIESVDGKAATIIDGGGTNRCATLGWTTNALVRGFRLTNGKASEGGAAYNGTLEDCDVVGNVATRYGGGLCCSAANRCRIMGNAVQGTSWYAEGGGAYYGILRNCLVAGNSACSSERVDGGGTCYGTCYNCTIVSNSVFGATRCDGGGAYGGSLYNTIVYGNTATNVPDEVTSISRAFSSRVGADPLFADAANGDYRLAAGSPCIDAGGNNYVMDDVDLDGNARVQHYTVDIGCYEYALATPERDAEADFAAQMAGMCYGVFVGVSQYTYTSSLVGPTVDATNMQTRCVDKGYWHGSNTVAFLDAMATKSAVRARLTSLAAKAVLGDTVLYYQSSHGGSHASGGNYTKDTYICLHDATYEDYEMASDLMQFAAGVKVVVVLDTCHSAGMFKAMGAAQNPASTSGMSFARRVHELVAERAALRKGAKSGITADDIGWIAAADYNQYSWDSARGGAFTVAMLDGWKSGAADYDGDKRLNFHELWCYARGIATGYSGEDATDAQCLNEEVLLSRFAGVPDSSADNEATKTTPMPVKYVWLDSYPTILAAFGGDYEAMANAQSPGASGGGKTWQDGAPCYVWQDFVAGTSPTNDAVFTAVIRMEGNAPVVTWEPDTPELRASRVYRTLGKKTLLDANWTDITDEDKSGYYFFKVKVHLP